MRIDVVSIFPEMFDAVATAGITGRALDRGLWQLARWNPRDYTDDNYRRVDDRAYGGGPGMVMLVEPLTRALDAVQAAQRAGVGAIASTDPLRNATEAATAEAAAGPVLLMSPQGRRLDHELVLELGQAPALTLICGRYEAIDQRFVDARVDAEVSIGDFVVSGGELPAMLLIDALVRLVPGAVNDPASVQQDSFAEGLLDAPHYTRPEVLGGQAVPPVLLSGNHANIARWRREQALQATQERRPDLIAALRAKGGLSDADKQFLTKLTRRTGR